MSGAVVSSESLGVSLLEGIVREEGNENLTKQSVKFLSFKIRCHASHV